MGSYPFRSFWREKKKKKKKKTPNTKQKQKQIQKQKQRKENKTTKPKQNKTKTKQQQQKQRNTKKSLSWCMHGYYQSNLWVGLGWLPPGKTNSLCKIQFYIRVYSADNLGFEIFLELFFFFLIQGCFFSKTPLFLYCGQKCLQKGLKTPFSAKFGRHMLVHVQY